MDPRDPTAERTGCPLDQITPTAVTAVTLYHAWAASDFRVCWTAGGWGDQPARWTAMVTLVREAIAEQEAERQRDRDFDAIAAEFNAKREARR